MVKLRGSVSIRTVVAVLAVLLLPASVFAACSDYGDSAYDACYTGNVRDPDNNIYDCQGTPSADKKATCIVCVYTYCVANTYFCRNTCIAQGSSWCEAANGCSISRHNLPSS